jgi:o-succinylbenzoate synthase
MRTLIDLDTVPVFALPTSDGVREGVLVEGPQGWGEFSPPAGADDALAARWLTAAMEPSTVGWPDAVRGRVAASPHGADVVEVVGGDVASAVAAVSRCSAELVELRCVGAAQAKAVRRAVTVPVAVEASLLLQDRECADVVVLQAGSYGGVRRALRWAERLGVPVLVHPSGLTSIGVAADVALAAALQDQRYAVGPVPAWLGEADVVSPARSLVPRDGFLPAAPMPAGPDRARLERYAVTDPEVVERWRALLRRAAALI